MIVRTVNGGEDAVRAILYTPPSEQLVAYVNNNINNALSAITNASQEFVNATKTMFNNATNSNVINAGKMLLNQLGNMGTPDAIQYLTTEQLHTANIGMQYWIMECPEVRTLYNQNMCYGYGDTYVDMEEGIENPEDRSGYNRVMSGILQFESDGSGYFRHYEDSSDVDPLSTIDQFTILDTWHNARQALLKGIDITDPNGGKL